MSAIKAPDPNETNAAYQSQTRVSKIDLETQSSVQHKSIVATLVVLVSVLVIVTPLCIQLTPDLVNLRDLKAITITSCDVSRKNSKESLERYQYRDNKGVLYSPSQKLSAADEKNVSNMIKDKGFAKAYLDKRGRLTVHPDELSTKHEFVLAVRMLVIVFILGLASAIWRGLLDQIKECTELGRKVRMTRKA